jgi:hypothetical protein
VGFQVITAASVKIWAFWDIAPCSLGVYRRFRGAYCLWNVGILQRDYTVLYPRRLQSLWNSWLLNDYQLFRPNFVPLSYLVIEMGCEGMDLSDLSHCTIQLPMMAAIILCLHPSFLVRKHILDAWHVLTTVLGQSKHRYRNVSTEWHSPHMAMKPRHGCLKCNCAHSAGARITLVLPLVFIMAGKKTLWFLVSLKLVAYRRAWWNREHGN